MSAPEAPPPLPPSGFTAQSNDLALASLISGLVAVASMMCCCIPVASWGAWVVVPTSALTAIVTGAIGLARAPTLGGAGRREAIAGVALGVLALSVIVGGVLLVVVAGMSIVGLSALAH